MSKELDRGSCLALALNSCAHCLGLGRRHSHAGSLAVCQCVYRAIFRACYARFRHCAGKASYVSRVCLEANRGQQHRAMYGMKNQEYLADFCLVAKRTLPESEHRLFRYHFVLGADWKLCTRKLATDRGTFFHAVYRIQQKLGKAFATLQPHALWPLDEYFGGLAYREPHAVLLIAHPEEELAAPARLRFPVAKGAA